MSVDMSSHSPKEDREQEYNKRPTNVSLAQILCESKLEHILDGKSFASNLVEEAVLLPVGGRSLLRPISTVPSA